MTHMGKIGRCPDWLRISVRVLCMRRHSIIAGQLDRLVSAWKNSILIVDSLFRLMVQTGNNCRRQRRL